MNGAISSILIFVLPALLILIGLPLLFLALRGRRIGLTPFCRNCGYNLTGVWTDPPAAAKPASAAKPPTRENELVADAPRPRCPECGDALHPKVVLIGQRIRRPLAIVAGVLLTLLGVAPLTAIAVGTAYNYDWYRLKPASWVLDDVETPNSSVAGRAFRELDRRWRMDELPSASRDRFIGFCLRQASCDHARNRLSAPSSFFLWQCFTRDGLSRQQQDEFFEHLVRIQHLFRSPVPRGESLIVRLNLVDRPVGFLPSAAGERCEVSYTLGATMLDGRAISDGASGGEDLSNGQMTFWRGMVEFTTTIDLSPGDYVIRTPAKIRVEAKCTPYDGSKPREVVHEYTVEINDTVTVTP